MSRMVRKRIFQQNQYPLNTFFSEHFLWTTLVMPITEDIPPPQSRYFLSDPDLSAGPMESIPMLDDCVSPGRLAEAFGRTFKCDNAKGMQRFCKIQSAQESQAVFLRTYQRLEWVKKNRHALGLESEVVTPLKVARLDQPSQFIKRTGLAENEQDRLLAQTGKEARLAMLFSCPEDKPYEQYVYDVQDPQVAMEGLKKYASDYGRLWKYGLMGPAVINAYHDIDKNRRHTFLSIYIDSDSEGNIERWNGQATNYPNVGGSVGMRDQGDIRKPEEIEEGFDAFPKCTYDPLVNNKIRLNELGRTAQGLILLYARRFQGGFDCSSVASVQAVEQDIGSLLSKLFCHAAPLSEQACLKFMQEDGLLSQCAREVSYWTAKDVPYVHDLRRAVINRDVYPHLPAKMRGAVLTDNDQAFLTDKGFHDPTRDVGDECQLGVGSGRNPLIALHALITKMLCHTVVAMKVADTEGAATSPPKGGGDDWLAV
ncbi:hypothetical protein E1189_12210 [Sansalvadorimonas verongulae]|nr:hypothetical protein [Sansalvadorimonas verongulae]